MRLLLADNDPDYLASLQNLLEVEDYQVDVAASVDQAIALLAEERFDLALIDLRLIDENAGYDLSGLKVARAAGEAGVPCIMVTAFPSVEVVRQALRSQGLSPLALDVVPKDAGPVSLLDAIRSFRARLRDQSRHGSPARLVLDLERGLASLDGEPLSLSKLQYRLLAYLYERQGAVCTPQELFEAVYGEHIPGGQASADKRLEHLVTRLREKIEDDPSEPRYLITEHGRGLRLEPEG
jgi:two-component system response regulator VicR